MRSGAVFWPCPRWWLGWLAPVCLLICSCATPALSPASDVPTKPHGEAPPASEAIERRTVLQPDADENVNQNPRQQRERLESRVQAVVTCLEEARQAVVAAEVAGAGIETVRPTIDALKRSEAALREAQAQLLRGEAAQAALPLDTAETECRAARDFSQQI